MSDSSYHITKTSELNNTQKKSLKTYLHRSSCFGIFALEYIMYSASTYDVMKYLYLLAWDKKFVYITF